MNFGCGSNTTSSWFIAHPRIEGGADNWEFEADTGGGISDRGLGDDFSTDLDGFIGGIHAGYNWQAGAWVWGAEASVSGTGIDGDELSTFGAADDVYSTDIEWTAGATLKVGYAFDRVLLYAKGGYAGASIETSIDDDVGPLLGSASSSEWHNGYSIGAGIDYAWTDNVIVGFEYKYSDFGSEEHTVNFGTGETVTDNVDVDLHSVLFNISYKF